MILTFLCYFTVAKKDVTIGGKSMRVYDCLGKKGGVNGNKCQKRGNLLQLYPLERVKEGFMEETSFVLNYRSVYN